MGNWLQPQPPQHEYAQTSSIVRVYCSPSGQFLVRNELVRSPQSLGPVLFSSSSSSSSKGEEREEEREKEKEKEKIKTIPAPAPLAAVGGGGSGELAKGNEKNVTSMLIVFHNSAPPEDKEEKEEKEKRAIDGGGVVIITALQDFFVLSINAFAFTHLRILEIQGVAAGTNLAKSKCEFPRSIEELTLSNVHIANYNFDSRMFWEHLKKSFPILKRLSLMNVLDSFNATEYQHIPTLTSLTMLDLKLVFYLDTFLKQQQPANLKHLHLQAKYWEFEYEEEEQQQHPLPSFSHLHQEEEQEEKKEEAEEEEKNEGEKEEDKRILFLLPLLNFLDSYRLEEEREESLAPTTTTTTTNATRRRRKPFFFLKK